jgi:hypothetical protein
LEPSGRWVELSRMSDRSTAPGQQVRTGGKSFSCFVSTRISDDPEEWRYGSGEISFPAAELASDGSVVAYKGRGYAGSDKLVSVVNCLIPHTEAARVRMDRNLGVRRTGLGGPRPEEIAISIQTVELERMVVIGNWCPYGGIYPNCRTDPTAQAAPECAALDPACGAGGGGSDGSDGWSWGGGGSTPTPEDACPATDPACLLPLNDEQRAALIQALSLVKTSFADPQAAAACAELKVEAERLLPNKVFAGNSEIPDDPNNPAAHHDAQQFNGMIHIDADVFDFAIYGGNYRVLGLLLLHETAHVLGYTHPNESHEPYSAPPFTYVSRDSGVETCM